MSGANLEQTTEEKLTEAAPGGGASPHSLDLVTFPIPLVHPRSPLLAASTAHVSEVKKTPPLEQFLQHIAFGEESKAEGMLREQQSLARDKGDLRDPSAREFKQITGFQYAVWGLDWRMWKMLLKYMDKQEAAAQFMELNQHGTVHGKRFSLQPLLDALQSNFEHYDVASSQAKDLSVLTAHWNQQVGGEQLLLPAHIVQEYCHPLRRFSPCPNFKEINRSESLMTPAGNWYTALRDAIVDARPFAYLRGFAKQAQVLGGQHAGNPIVKFQDYQALEKLSKTCEQQLESLTAELIYSSALSIHLPTALVRTVLSYLPEDIDDETSADDAAASPSKP